MGEKSSLSRVVSTVPRDFFINTTLLNSAGVMSSYKCFSTFLIVCHFFSSYIKKGTEE